MVKFQNSLSFPSAFFMNRSQILWYISWVRSREYGLFYFDCRHFEDESETHEDANLIKYQDFPRSLSQMFDLSIYFDQHYIFLPPIRSSSQSPCSCLPSSVIPTSLLRSPGSRFRLLRHVRPDHFFFSFLSDHSTSSTSLFRAAVNTALMD